MLQPYRLLAGIFMTCLVLLLHGCSNEEPEAKVVRPIPSYLI